MSYQPQPYQPQHQPPAVYQQPPPPVPYQQPYQPVQYQAAPPIIPLSARFEFDGGAGTFLGTGILAWLITVLTLGLGLPWAICVYYSWRTKHTIIDGYRLRFAGSGGRLFGNWIKWWFFCIITLGIYSFWVVPRLVRWITRNQQFDMSAPRSAV